MADEHRVSAVVTPEDDLYRLVYARWGAVEDEMVEPLIAVARSEEEARAIYLEVVGQDSSCHVSWEHWPLTLDGGGPNEVGSGVLHIVVQGADCWLFGDAREWRDPIGVAIHSTKAGADDHAARLNEKSLSSHAVVSVPVDYRRPGWPFAADAPAPLPGEMPPFGPGRGKRYSR